MAPRTRSCSITPARRRRRIGLYQALLRSMRSTPLSKGNFDHHYYGQGQSLLIALRKHSEF